MTIKALLITCLALAGSMPAICAEKPRPVLKATLKSSVEEERINAELRAGLDRFNRSFWLAAMDGGQPLPAFDGPRAAVEWAAARLPMQDVRDEDREQGVADLLAEVLESVQRGEVQLVDISSAPKASLYLNPLPLSAKIFYRDSSRSDAAASMVILMTTPDAYRLGPVGRAEAAGAVKRESK